MEILRQQNWIRATLEANELVAPGLLNCAAEMRRSLIDPVDDLTFTFGCPIVRDYFSLSNYPDTRNNRSSGIPVGAHEAGNTE